MTKNKLERTQKRLYLELWRGPIAITDCVLNYHHQLAKCLAVRSHSAFTLYTDPVVHSQNRTDTAKHRKKQPSPTVDFLR